MVLTEWRLVGGGLGVILFTKYVGNNIKIQKKKN